MKQILLAILAIGLSAGAARGLVCEPDETKYVSQLGVCCHSEEPTTPCWTIAAERKYCTADTSCTDSGRPFCSGDRSATDESRRYQGTTWPPQDALVLTGPADASVTYQKAGSSFYLQWQYAVEFPKPPPGAVTAGQLTLYSSIPGVADPGDGASLIVAGATSGLQCVIPPKRKQRTGELYWPAGNTSCFLARPGETSFLIGVQNAGNTAPSGKSQLTIAGRNNVNGPAPKLEMCLRGATGTAPPTSTRTSTRTPHPPTVTRTPTKTRTVPHTATRTPTATRTRTKRPMATKTPTAAPQAPPRWVFLCDDPAPGPDCYRYERQGGSP